jgi:hypothetical protein
VFEWQIATLRWVLGNRTDGVGLEGVAREPRP